MHRLQVEFLRLDHPNNNIHNLRLIEALVQCGTMAMGTGADRARDTDRHREAQRESGSCVATLYSLGLADSLVAVHTPCTMIL